MYSVLYYATLFKQTNIHQWRVIFSIAGGFTFVGNLFFLIFGTAKVQWWNERPRIVSETEQLEQLVGCLGKTNNTTEVLDGEVRKPDVEQSAV